MLRSKHIERICCIALILTLVFTCVFLGAAASGMIDGERLMGYEARLFDSSRVHTLELVMDDWEGFLETCRNEEYAQCAVIIDGESYKNVAIRAKGNTSLSSVESYGNDRYSFKIEFDHYENGKTYHGLDKLSLNNLIQDSTHMKDYLSYTLMGKMGVASPLCSFVEIRVNGEYWGLYLAVEGVEDSFLARNFGSDYGELYKPDSLSFGGGRGNGMDFDMEEMKEKFSQMQQNTDALPQGMQLPGAMPAGQGEMPGGMQWPDFPGVPGAGNNRNGGDRGGMGAMGSSDVMLQYSDDNPESYANIFDSAKTDATEADQQRLIGALKKLSEGDVSAVDQEQVIRYLAVHHFLCNDDSYTGSMIHNYYLYEENGALSMIPWDYNLAFGAFSMGQGGNATLAVNRGIDTPVSSGDVSSRPILSWIFASEENMNRYHAIYRELLEDHLESGWLEEEIIRVSGMIAPYVEKDPTSFFTYEEFQRGTAALKEFCALRTQSIRGQLDGVIPTTTQAQTGSNALIDASHLNLSDMGSMGNVGGKGGDRDGAWNREGNPFRTGNSTWKTETPRAAETPATPAETIAPTEMAPMPGGMMGGGQFPGGNMGNMQPMGTPPAMPDGMQMPEGMGNMGMGGMPPDGMMPGANMPPVHAGAMETTAPMETNAPAEMVPAVTAAPAETAGEKEEIPAQDHGAEFPETQRSSDFTREIPAGFAPDRGNDADQANWILLGASVLALIIGLVIAKFSKGNYK
ncbi:MAG: CotH kinase family protein [Clostridia bacterium]|nr:CotH kinase family protein [Clostridia bacterium]